MASMAVYQVSYLREDKDLFNENLVIAWLEAIAASGYYVTEIDEPFEERYGEVLQTHSLAPGISSLAREAVRQFCHDHDEELACNIYALTDDFTLVVTLFAPEGSVIISTDDSNFSSGETHQQKYEMFLALVEITYRQWHPIYGFDHAGAGDEPTPNRDEALQLEASNLFTINLFGPEYVAKLGRERILSVPVWQKRELDDGGVMVVPLPYIKEDWRQPQTYDMRTIAKQLGLSF